MKKRKSLKKNEKYLGDCTFALMEVPVWSGTCPRRGPRVFQASPRPPTTRAGAHVWLRALGAALQDGNRSSWGWHPGFGSSEQLCISLGLWWAPWQACIWSPAPPQLLAVPQLRTTSSYRHHPAQVPALLSQPQGLAAARCPLPRSPSSQDPATSIFHLTSLCSFVVIEEHGASCHAAPLGPTWTSVVLCALQQKWRNPSFSLSSNESSHDLHNFTFTQSTRVPCDQYVL